MQDFIIDGKFDLQIENGDFKVDKSTLQHQNHIILSEKGEFKNSPEIGAGIRTALNDENPRNVLSEIRRNFEYDGMKVKTLKVASNGNLLIDAEYN